MSGNLHRGGVIPIVIIGIAVVVFLPRRRKESRAGAWRKGIEPTDPYEPAVQDSNKIVVEPKYNSNTAPEQSRLHGISVPTAAPSTTNQGETEKEVVVHTSAVYQQPQIDC